MNRELECGSVPIPQWALVPRRLFLLDGFGAFLSAVLLGIVLVRLQPLVGMPTSVLYPLAGAATGFCLHSLGCAFFPPSNWRRSLLTVAIANLTYCLITLGLILSYSQQLRPLGWVYFLAEIAIVVPLATLEIVAARQGRAE